MIKFVVSVLFLAIFTACAPEKEGQDLAQAVIAPAAADASRAQQEAFLDTYFGIYKAKDVDAMLALFDDDILGALYPATPFGRGIEAAAPGIRGDFESRPNSYAEMPHRFRIARDKWVTFGTSVNGEERAPMMIVFDLNETGDKIEATYTQIGWRGMIEGASVDEPTDAMDVNFSTLLAALAAEDFSVVAEQLAPHVALYAYPPTDFADQTPIISGAADVASVLAFKWGEGAWGGDLFTSQYMQFVFVGIPGENLDRVALFTFDADPASPEFEKIVRIDVMGPSGG